MVTTLVGERWILPFSVISRQRSSRRFSSPMKKRRSASSASSPPTLGDYAETALFVPELVDVAAGTIASNEAAAVTEPAQSAMLDRDECARLLAIAAAAQSGYREAMVHLEAAIGFRIPCPVTRQAVLLPQGGFLPALGTPAELGKPLMPAAYLHRTSHHCSRPQSAS